MQNLAGYLCLEMQIALTDILTDIQTFGYILHKTRAAPLDWPGIRISRFLVCRFRAGPF